MVRWQCRRGDEFLHIRLQKFKNYKRQALKRTGACRSNRKSNDGTFEIEGQTFYVLNGGPHFKFTEAISLFVNCETQEEVDELWEKLIANGGAESRCGWLKDKSGLSWQIIPSALGRLMGDEDPIKAQRVMQAMLKMKKIIVKDLQEAHDQK